MEPNASTCPFPPRATKINLKSTRGHGSRRLIIDAHLSRCLGEVSDGQGREKAEATLADPWDRERPEWGFGATGQVLRSKAVRPAARLPAPLSAVRSGHSGKGTVGWAQGDSLRHTARSLTAEGVPLAPALFSPRLSACDWQRLPQPGCKLPEDSQPPAGLGQHTLEQDNQPGNRSRGRRHGQPWVGFPRLLSQTSTKSRRGIRAWVLSRGLNPSVVA